MDKSAAKKQKTSHLVPKKRPRPSGDTSEAQSPNKRRITTSPRVDDIRLILESTATDDELAGKIHLVKAELQAVDGALGDEGSLYLGIVDKVRRGNIQTNILVEALRGASPP